MRFDNNTKAESPARAGLRFAAFNLFGAGMVEPGQDVLLQSQFAVQLLLFHEVLVFRSENT